jgi:hypothetical protein
MALLPRDEDDTDVIVPDLPDEMAECVWDAMCLGRQMRRATELSGGPYTEFHNPFAPNSELAWAWRKGFFNPLARISPVYCPERVNWKRDGF